jgi:hypothetical protein
LTLRVDGSLTDCEVATEGGFSIHELDNEDDITGLHEESKVHTGKLPNELCLKCRLVPISCVSQKSSF